MRTEEEIRERLEHWKLVLGGVLKEEETKKTIKRLIEELEWVPSSNLNSAATVNFITIKAAAY